jgi:hypothetical protein
MLQAIDRLRLIHTQKRKTVYILCNIPLDLPVDELVTWKQLTGDRRLADALAECDERGWDALPLAAKEMSRLFPNLWATEKAVERWVAKNPLEASHALPTSLSHVALAILLREHPDFDGSLTDITPARTCHQCK